MSSQILLAGLPASGKSTFIAALWYVVKNPDSCPGCLALDVLGGDKEYLNALTAHWLCCSDLHRTNPERAADDLLELSTPSGDRFGLSLPDHRGENFMKVWTDRNWQEEFTVAARAASGLLLFVRGDDIIQPISIRAVGGNGTPEDEDVGEEEVEAKPFDPREVPTQVVLVDMLQLAVRVRLGRPLRTAVMVTARDALNPVERDLPVADFVGRELPLLSQYLAANPVDHPAKMWSISAQGGDYERDGKELAEKGEPASRIEVVEEDAQCSHDITNPIKWLLATEES